MRRGVLVELAQLEQGENHLLIPVHSHRQRADHRFGFGQRKLSALEDFAVHRLNRLRFFAERV